MHFMNPFEFVPLPEKGPKELPQEAYDGPRLEGYLSYYIRVLTPLHITGRTSALGKTFDRKEFYENYGNKVIPGASVRGMLSAFIEALTGSDLRVFTRGYEAGKSGIPAYGKHFDSRCRHTGFLMAAADDKDEKTAAARNQQISYRHNDQQKTRKIHERTTTLPNGFGRHLKTDAARFLFGFVDENSEEQSAKAGRVIFEDILISPKIRMQDCKAWDLEGDAIMGGPNPRANTGWYFTPGESRIRQSRGIKSWEVLADKVRGRKFYFHQEPGTCHEQYRKWCQWMKLREYKVETVVPGTEILNARIYFSDLPEPMLNLLVFSLMLESGMAHKLGALKPFGFGSVQLIPDGLLCRDMAAPLENLREPEQLRFAVNDSLFDEQARRFLEKIMYVPKPEEKKDWIFVYPRFRPGRNVSPEEKGFAAVPKVKPGTEGKTRVFPKEIEKITLFFDYYQTKAVNFRQVMGGDDYSHLRKGK